MNLPTVSVIVVSHGRPDALRLCLTGLAQLDYPHFEIVVVADPEGVAAVQPYTGQIKAVAFDEPNISAARNAGLAQAAGDIVAFIDDDAVPEPTWLTYLCAPFADEHVAASGGYVIGRNGISFQWTARQVTPDGQTNPLNIGTDKAQIFEGSANVAIKTEGTNMALRRAVICAIGGFDPVFRFYLDETDLNMRIAKQGFATAIVPVAQVHHGYAASSRRTVNRAPRDLFQIGASLAAFQRKHAPDCDLDAALSRETARQRKRLIRFMVSGQLSPGDVGGLLKTLRNGWEEGLLRDFGTSELQFSPPPFLPFPGRFTRPHVVISGRFWQRKQSRAAARSAVAAGHRVSVYLLSYSALYHHVSFQPDGYWEQSGGQFGRSLRSDTLWRWWRKADRVAREVARVQPVRAPGDV